MMAKKRRVKVKSDSWDITSVNVVLHKGVQFDRPVDEEEARERFEAEEYEDVVDTEFLETQSIIEAEPLNPSNDDDISEEDD